MAHGEHSGNRVHGEGLRALYFALAAVAKYFTYLKYGLGVILSFVGVKMLLELRDIEIPTTISLAVIFGLLVLSMGLSVILSKRKTKLNQ